MKTLVFVFTVFGVCHCVIFRRTGDIYENRDLHYMYRFLSIDRLNAAEFRNGKDGYHKGLSGLIELQKQFRLFKQQNIVPNVSQNFFKLLEGFQSENCLLLIDNWQKLDIHPASTTPLILHSLQLALSHRILMQNGYKNEDIESLLLQTGIASEDTEFLHYDLLNTTKHYCPISRFYSPLDVFKENDAFCVDLDHKMFLLKSRPWHCEIEVSLLMPDFEFEHNIFPGLFRYNYNFQFEFPPSSRPKVHMFIELERDNFDPIDLFLWVSNTELYEKPVLKGGHSSQNNIHLSGQLFCKPKIDFNLVCDISSLNYLSYCLDCPTLPSSKSISLKALSFEYITSKLHNDNLWLGGFYSQYKRKEHSLSVQIPYFTVNERDAIMAPLKYYSKIKVKYTDDIQVLAFGFSSVLKHLVGNVTAERGPYFEICLKKCDIRVLYREASMHESVLEKDYMALQFDNKFASLRFVSCGSRGIEDLKIWEFVSVFDTNLWTWLLAFGAILVFTMSLIRGSICSLKCLDKIVCLIKVLLEQGDPFPDRFLKSKPFRYLICGTLLAGLVLSNAFKSTNVYNIVLPKQPLKFSTIEELKLHGYSVYSKLGDISYAVIFLHGALLDTRAEIDEIISPNMLNIYDDKGKQFFEGYTELSIYKDSISDTSQKFIGKEMSSLPYLRNNTKPHLGLHEIIVEPLMSLNPLVQIGFMNWHHILSYSMSDMNFGFWKKQEKFIVDELKKCNKTAWLLPDYQAQKLSRLLVKLNKHSDVGAESYFKTKFNLMFRGSLSFKLIRKVSMVSSSGLLDWWSKFVNRTDLVRHMENQPPVKPTMSGNIQIIFIMHAIGMFIANISWLLELHEYIFRMINCLVFTPIRLFKKILRINVVRRF